MEALKIVIGYKVPDNQELQRTHQVREISSKQTDFSNSIERREERMAAGG